MITKRILFYFFLTAAIISAVSLLTCVTTLTLIGSAVCIWLLVRRMTVDEINTMIGAKWLNKVFKTETFTEDE